MGSRVGLASCAENRHREPMVLVPRWLVAYNTAAIATFRAVALHSSHPQPRGWSPTP